MKKFLLLSALLTLVIGFSSDEKTEPNIRAVFISTANNVIEVNPSKAHKKTHKNYQFTKAEIPAGIELKVYKILKNGEVKEVNLKRNVLKTGDEFFIEFRTNVPGIVQAINITPDKRVKPLGVWSVPAFFPVRLPPNGNFKLVKKKGKEKLVLILYPCKPKAYTKDLEITNYNSYQVQLKPYVGKVLPACNSERTADKKHIAGIYLSSNGEIRNARDIEFVLSKYKPQYATYEQGAYYYITPIKPGEVKPIVATIEIIHR